MNASFLLFLTTLLAHFGLGASSILLLSSSAIFLSATSFIFKGNPYCQFFECCNRNWIRVNKTELDEQLSSRVYGQPMVKRLSEAITEHWRVGSNPNKALAIVLHGPTGTGKNYAVSIIVNSLYRLAARSRHYHFFSAAVHFPHKKHLAHYADQLSQWIRGNVSLCPQSLFVFDEVDKLPARLLDVLKPFTDYHDNINGVDYRKAIFIMLSNSGSELIMRKMIKLKRTGGSRESGISALEFDLALSSHAYNDANSDGLRNSALLKHHLVSRFIPFLPLEREHVIGCINDYLSASVNKRISKELRQTIINKVINYLPFVPQQEKFFSSAGCKRIVDKTLMLLDEIDINY